MQPVENTSQIAESTSSTRERNKLRLYLRYTALAIILFIFIYQFIRGLFSGAGLHEDPIKTIIKISETISTISDEWNETMH